MLIAALLANADNIDCHNSAPSKKRIIETISQMLAKNIPEVSADSIFQALLERERLGSTGLGRGVAIPHARIPGLTHTVAAMMTLESPVNYDSADNHPVDIVVGLLVPEEGGEHHLQHLSRLVTLFRQTKTCRIIRDANSPEQVFEILLAIDDD
jgi:PTS system nitrogen regulatory IIA component